MKLTAFSDTHMLFPKSLNPSKYLVYAGDLESGKNTPDESKAITIEFLKWFRKQHGHYKVMIAGNHDLYFWHNPEGFRKLCEEYGVILLNHEVQDIGGIRFFGSPQYFTCRANPEPVMEDFPEPGSFDVLLTHVPPYGILDFACGKVDNIGSKPLREYVQEHKPKLHIFGHCHEGYSSLCSPFYNVALRSRNNKKVLINEPVSLEISHMVNK